jgi:hypothetical protein
LNRWLWQTIAWLCQLFLELLVKLASDIQYATNPLKQWEVKLMIRTLYLLSLLSLLHSVNQVGAQEGQPINSLVPCVSTTSPPQGYIVIDREVLRDLQEKCGFECRPVTLEVSIKNVNKALANLDATFSRARNEWGMKQTLGTTDEVQTGAVGVIRDHREIFGEYDWLRMGDNPAGPWSPATHGDFDFHEELRQVNGAVS